MNREERTYRREWKLSDLWLLLRNSFIAMLKGEFLLRLNVGKYFIHVMYTFFLFALIIWISLLIETTMAKVEKNKESLNILEIEHAELIYELSSVQRRTTVEKQLKALDSKVTEPSKPAQHINNK